MKPNFEKIAALPKADDRPDNHYIMVIKDGLFWGHFKRAKTWTGHAHWMRCTEYGDTF